MALLEGLSSEMIDTSDLQYQANPKYMPDKGELHTIPFEKDGWTEAHNALRAEIAQLSQMIKLLGNRRLEPWEKKAFQNFWNFHDTHMHDHHSNEDILLAPLIAERIKLPERLTTDHEKIVDHLKKIGPKVKSLTSASDVREDLEVYKRDLLPHLIEEERISLPLVRAYFTPAEYDAMIQKILNKLPPSIIGATFYWMASSDPDNGDVSGLTLDSVRKATSEFILRTGAPPFVPPLAWHMQIKFGVKKYMREVEAGAQGVLNGKPPQEEKFWSPFAACLSKCRF
eukprot:scaffold228340_cov31-Tisochrysis_lutea.AAC.2